MKNLKILSTLATASAFALILLTGCDNKADNIAIAEQAGISVPGIEETRAIAEEGFIYGLPLVMNYAIMNEYAVDPNSSQFKAPFNQIKSLARVFTYKDTAVVTANSDTPYSFLWMDLRAEPVVLSLPAVSRSVTSRSCWPTRTLIITVIWVAVPAGKGSDRK